MWFSGCACPHLACVSASDIKNYHAILILYEFAEILQLQPVYKCANYNSNSSLLQLIPNYIFFCWVDAGFNFVISHCLLHLTAFKIFGLFYSCHGVVHITFLTKIIFCAREIFSLPSSSIFTKVFNRTFSKRPTPAPKLQQPETRNLELILVFKWLFRGTFRHKNTSKKAALQAS